MRRLLVPVDEEHRLSIVAPATTPAVAMMRSERDRWFVRLVIGMVLGAVLGLLVGFLAPCAALLCE